MRQPSQGVNGAWEVANLYVRLAGTVSVHIHRILLFFVLFETFLTCTTSIKRTDFRETSGVMLRC